MSAVVTEKWSAKGKGDNASNATLTQTGVRVVTVSGVSTETDALAASGVPQINDAYETGSTIRCYGRNALPAGIGVYEVTAQYQTGVWTVITSPLSQPATYDWQPVVVELPMDRDVDGNPIVNTAGDPPSREFTRTYIYRTLRITKNKPYYDPATLDAYENAVNSDTITYTEPNGHTVSFAPGSIKSVTVSPGRPYTVNDLYVPIVATLETWNISQEQIDGGTLTQPFQLRYMDEGSIGWADDGGTPVSGVIVSKDGQKPDFPVRLDGSGQTFDTSRWKIRVGDRLLDPASNPSVPTWLDVENGANAVYLVAKRYRAIELQPLFDLMA